VEHVVFFPAPDGSPAFRRVPSLDEAVRLVEHLRNVEGLSTVSVHALTEVPLAFRTYYRVEVPAAVEAQVPAQPVVEAPVAVEPEAAVEVEPVHEAPALALVEDAPAEEPVLVSSNGHAPQSLGFFA
jgi:hypothetical protein